MQRMPFRLATPVVIASVALGAALAPHAASAAWPLDGRPACDDVAVQANPSITSDGAGGALVAWEDFRSPPSKIAVQHVLASGDLDPVWPHLGRVVVGNPDSLANAPGGENRPVIVPDGAGGAIVAFQDDRSAVTETDVYAQHILASGERDETWPANGTALDAIAGLQDVPVMVSDGAGGAIVAWMDSRPGASVVDLYAQHVLASGLVDPRWPANGLAVSTAPGPQEFPDIVEDGAGGAIVAWYDQRGGVTGFDVYAQHLLASGTVDPAWPANGRAVCTAAGDQFEASIASDGAGGAVIAWTDTRVAGTSQVFAHHVLASGVVDPAWPVNGRAVSSAATPESTSPRVVSDAASGAIVTWHDFSGHWSQFAQRVTRAGVLDPAWPADGRALAASTHSQINGVAVADGQGGAVVAWEEDGDIVAQRVLASGTLDPAYPVTGRVICGLPSAQADPALVATGAGGAIAAWTDDRTLATATDIYVMQVLESITTGVPDSSPIGIAFGHAGPNPAREAVLLRFSLPREAPADLAIYDVRGRRVRVLASGSRPAGTHAVSWDLRDDRGRAVGAGLYFARLEAEGRTFTTKISTLR